MKITRIFESKGHELVHSPIAYVLSLLFTGVWMITILVGPLLYRLPEKFSYLADIYYVIFNYTCHQIPSRCYWLFGYQMPVCVRCLGIYLGAFLGLALYPVIKNVRSLEFPSKWWLLACFGPIGIDGIAQVLHLYPSPHWLRLLTGALCGGIAMFYVVPGLNDVVRIINKENNLF